MRVVFFIFLALRAISISGMRISCLASNFLKLSLLKVLKKTTTLMTFPLKQVVVFRKEKVNNSKYFRSTGYLFCECLLALHVSDGPIMEERDLRKGIPPPSLRTLLYVYVTLTSRKSTCKG